jgi:ABC-type lipoprotein release transport system permease subunit
MIWFKIAWRNLWRNRRRTCIQLAAIIGGMFLAVFYNNFVGGFAVNTLDGGVRSGSGHIGIYHERYLEDPDVAETVPADALVARIAQDPDVTEVFPRLHVAGLLRSSRDTRPAAVMGLDFAREGDGNPMLNAKNLVAGHMPTTPNRVVIGQALAKELKVKVGKKVVWVSQDVHGEIVSRLFRVSGILNTHVKALDASLILAPRESVAELIGRPGSAHEVAVMLKSPDRIPAALPRLQAIAVTAGTTTKAYAWDDAMPSLAALVQASNAKEGFIVVILFALVAVGTMNTMLMSVMERTREFGMIRAMGVSKGAIRLMVLVEGLVLGLIGSLIGVGLAFLLNLRTSTAGIDLTKAYGDMDMGGIAFDMLVKTVWDWRLALLLLAGMVVLSVLASLYPARWALKIRPADAMRTY